VQVSRLLEELLLSIGMSWTTVQARGMLLIVLAEAED
jgi:hypothetical protein